LSGILGHLYICDKEGYVPFVDMEKHPGTYSESFPVFGTENMWEYYFLPVSVADKKEVYASENWIDSQGRFPHEVMDSLFGETPWLLATFDKYVSLREESKQFLTLSRENMGIARDVLGVHFRGTDMRTTADHPMPPSEKQVFKRVDNALATSNFDRIHLVTDHENYLNSFSRRYGSRMTSLNVARSGLLDVYKEYPRPNHRYLLGLETLVETHLLAECGGLISGYSGVSEMARVLSRGKHRLSEQIWNGRLRGGRLSQKFLWAYRSKTHRLLGGFSA